MDPALQSEYGFSRKQMILGLIAVFAVYGTTAYSVQTLNIARPRMAAELDGMPLYSWLMSIPALFGAFVTLIFGKFSDMYGRRVMLMVSLSFFLAGSMLCAISPTFIFLIVSNCVGRIGSGALMMLCVSVLGDMFPPLQRSKWIGLLNIPAGIFALFGPTLGGWFVDNLSWRYLYWLSVPLIGASLALVPLGIPPIKKREHTIDIRGCILMIVASSTMILGFSFAGTTYAWSSPQVISLLGTSLIFWVLFIKGEEGVKEPILDPQVLRNRTFLTVASATLLSFFGQVGILLYFPVFLQGVQGITATHSGQIITPYSFFMAFVGVPVGFILARTKRYKWMYVFGYGLLTFDMAAVVFFTADTPVLWSVLVAAVAGIGLGAFPTVNTMVVQNAIPKRLLGVSMGAIFFCISMGIALAPAILGSAMNLTYQGKLKESLPAALKDVADNPAMASLGNSRVLLDPAAMASLEAAFKAEGADGEVLFKEAIQAIRVSMEAGLRSTFLISTIAMLIAFLLICTVPEISMEKGAEDSAPAPPAAAARQAATGKNG
ncbi:MAG: MFS transporter [Acidobacteria bacterium]|nr:MFS transporter [Acidobacteriota bacterium]